MSGFLISLVVPVYNAAQHLPGLDSMLSVQEPGGWEVVFVNDGSADDSGKILDEISARGNYPAKVVHQINSGVSAARNAGMDASEGEFIAFLDADDGIAPDYISVMKKYAKAGRELTVFNHSRVVEGDFRYDIQGEVVQNIAPEAILEDFIMNPTRYGVYDFLIRRDVLDRGLRFPEGFPYYEDYHFTLRLFASAEDICRAGECIYCYRAAAGSAMSTFNVKRIESLKLFRDGMSLYMEKYPRAKKIYDKWFVPRICWSIMWQACVSMNAKSALELGRKLDARRHMKNLADHPDKRISLSAMIYLICPRAFAAAMAYLGKKRTLISRS